MTHSYADDTTLHGSISFGRYPSAKELACARFNMNKQIEKNLCNILEWGENNLVSFNASKTQLLDISVKKSPLEKIQMKSEKLKGCESIKILGVEIDKSLSWRCHLNSISKNASKRLSILRK